MTTTFDESVAIPPDALRLFDATGEQVEIGEPTHGASGTAITAVLPPLPDGTYVVAWKAISGDSHPISGAFAFQVGTSSTAPGDVAAVVPPDDGGRAPGVVDGVARFAALAGLAAVIGAVAFPWITGADWRDRRWLRLRATASVAAVGAATGALVAQVPVSAGEGFAAVADGDAWRSLLDTTAGRASVARVVILTLLALAVGRPRPRGDGVEAAALFLVAAAAVSSSMSGHASTGRWVPLAVVSTTVHTLAMGGWLGGLLVLAAVTLRSNGGGAERTVSRFSSAAFVAVVVIVLTGVFQAYRQLDGLDGLRSTDYGRLLLIKTVLVGALVAVAATSRRIVHGRLGLRPAGAAVDDEAARHDLRRRVRGEVALGAVVLAVTAALMAADPATARAGPVSVTASDDQVAVSIDIDPARAGENTIHLTVRGVSGAPTTVREVTLRASAVDRDVGPIAIPLTRVTDDHFTTDEADLPFPGRWELEVGVLLSDVDRAIVTATVDVS